MLISAFLSTIMKLKTFLDYSCAFAFFVIVTCPVKAAQLMRFITGSEKIPLVGLPSAIRVLLKQDWELGSNRSYCWCLLVISTCAIFIKVPVHTIKEAQMIDSFEKATSNEISFGIV